MRAAASSISTWAVFDLPEPTVPKMPTFRGSTSLLLLGRATGTASHPARVPNRMSPAHPSSSPTRSADKARTGDPAVGRSWVSAVRRPASSPIDGELQEA